MPREWWLGSGPDALVGLIGLERCAQHAEGKLCNQGPRGEEQGRLTDCTSTESLVGVESGPGLRAAGSAIVGTSSLARISQ